MTERDFYNRYRQQTQQEQQPVATDVPTGGGEPSPVGGGSRLADMMRQRLAAEQGHQGQPADQVHQPAQPDRTAATPPAADAVNWRAQLMERAKGPGGAVDMGEYGRLVAEYEARQQTEAERQRLETERQRAAAERMRAEEQERLRLENELRARAGAAAAGGNGATRGEKSQLEKAFTPEIPNTSSEIIAHAIHEMREMRRNLTHAGNHDWSTQIQYKTESGTRMGNIIERLPKKIRLNDGREIDPRVDVTEEIRVGDVVLRMTFAERLEQWLDAEGAFHKRTSDDYKASGDLKNFTGAVNFLQIEATQYAHIVNPMSPEGNHVGAVALDKAFKAYKGLLKNQPPGLVRIYNEIRAQNNRAPQKELPNLFTTGSVDELDASIIRMAVRRYSGDGNMEIGIEAEEKALRLMRIWKVYSIMDTKRGGSGLRYFGDELCKAASFLDWRQDELSKGQAGGASITAQEGVFPGNMLLSFLERTTIGTSRGVKTLDELLDRGMALHEIPWLSLRGDQEEQKSSNKIMNPDGSFLLSLTRTTLLVDQLNSLDINALTAQNNLTAFNKLVNSVISPTLVLREERTKREIDPRSRRVVKETIGSPHFRDIDEKDPELVAHVQNWKDSVKFNFLAGLVVTGRTPGGAPVYLGVSEVSTIISRAITAKTLKQTGSLAAGKLDTPPWGKPKPINKYGMFGRMFRNAA